MPSDIFLTTLRLTDNCDELKSTKELLSKEIQNLVSSLQMKKKILRSLNFRDQEIQVGKVT